MRRCGKFNPFLVAIIFNVPFITLCVDHNVTLTEKHDIAHGKINVSSVNSSLPSHAHENDVHHSTTNSTELKSPVSEHGSKPVVSIPSSTTKNPSKNESIHSSGHENVAVKGAHTSNGGQVMEGGGTLPLKKSKITSGKDPVKALNLTEVLPDIPKTSLEPHKNISPRKGAPVEMLSEEPGLPAVVSSTTTTTHRPTTKKLKPFYTMVKGDKFTKESESFIESPTTGKDYVLPLVLLIFAVPAFIFLVKFLYKRGTEFTERQQYHRMYLIDEL